MVRKEKFSSRRFSKIMMTINVGLTWGVIFFSVYEGIGGSIVPAGFGVICFLFSLYTGIGHLDYRKAIDGIASLPTASTPDSPEDTNGNT